MKTLILFLGLATPVAGADEATAQPAVNVRKNIPYVSARSPNRRLRSLDVYSPKSDKRHPVMVYIHGGGWRAGDKRAVHAKPSAFIKQGYVFISINYRLHPQADWKTQAADVAAAIQHVHRHVEKVGGDPDRIYLMGHSAGAHLAALVATDGRYLKNAGLSLSSLKGVVLLDGAGYDIPRRLARARPRARKLYETIFGKEQTAQSAASPVSHVEKGTGIPPFLIIHVAARPDSKKQSDILAESLKKAGVRAEVVAAKNKTHGTLNRELGTPGDVPTREVFRFLKSLKPAQATKQTDR